MAREMKDSGIDWLSLIPCDWVIKRNKSLFYEVNERCVDGSKLTLLSVSEYTGVTPRVSIIKDGEFETHAESLDGYKICKSGDIVMNIMLAWKRATATSRFDGIVSPAYSVYRGRGSVDTRYYHYLFRTDICADMFKRYSTGIIDSRLRLYPDVFLSLSSPVPSLEEQSRIADFLDTECGRIDAVIEQTRASIEEYKKLKQSVITQAVTKGIRPNRPMKDSGVEWIGEIAENFEIKKLKYLCYILDQYRSPVTADQRNQEAEILYDYYGASGAIDKIDGYTIDDHVMLIGEDGANLRLRNLPLMYEVNGKAWINNHAHILKPRENVDFDYLFFALESLDINTYITGSAQPKLSQENLKQIWVPVPDYEEQREIAQYLKGKSAEIDGIIDRKQHFLTELENLKRTIIYEYITGKKEVPE